MLKRIGAPLLLAVAILLSTAAPASASGFGGFGNVGFGDGFHNYYSRFFNSISNPFSFFNSPNRGWGGDWGCFKYWCKDKDNGNGEDEDVEISEIEFLNSVTETSVTVTWTTNVPASGEIEYGLSLEDIDMSEEESGSPSTSHEVVLTGLTPNTVYYFNILSDGESVGPFSFYTE